MTYKEKLSMCFNHLLDEIELIDNKELRDMAVLSLLQQVESQLTEFTILLERNDNDKSK